MSAKETIKRIVDSFNSKPYLKDKTREMGDGLLLGASLADDANELSKDVQAQVDQLIVNGDSSVEAAQARVDASGKSYTTLKKRLDEKETETTAQFQQIAKVVTGDSESDLTSKIQSALDKKGTIKIHSDVPTTYYISDTLWIDSDTKLELSDSVTLKQANGTNKYMLRNKGQQTSTRNKNIKVLGGTWDYNRLSNGILGDHWKITGNHAIFLWKVDNLKYKNIKVINVLKYAFLTVDCDGFASDNIRFDTHSDGLHFQPPLNNIKINNVSGTTGDDMISFTLGDYTNFDVSSIGNITNVDIDGVFPVDALCALKITGSGKGNIYHTKDVLIRNIRGTTTSSLITIYDDTYDGNATLTNTKVYGFVAEDITCGPSKLAQIYVEDGDIEFRNIDTSERTSSELILLHNNTKLNSLTIDGIKMKSAVTLVGANSGTKITDLFVSNMKRIDLDTPYVISSRAEIERATFENVTIKNKILQNMLYFNEKSGSLVKTKVTLINCDFDNLQTVTECKEAIDLYISNVRSKEQLRLIVFSASFLQTEKRASLIKLSNTDFIYTIVNNGGEVVKYGVDVENNYYGWLTLDKSLPAVVETPILFDEVNENYINQYNKKTGEFTALEYGFYLVNVQYMSGSELGDTVSGMGLNGSSGIYFRTNHQNVGVGQYVTGTTVVELNAGNSLRFLIKPTKAGTIKGGQYSTRMVIKKM